MPSFSAHGFDKLQLDDALKEEKHQTGWAPKAARGGPESGVNSQDLSAAASKAGMCLPPCLPLSHKMKKPNLSDWAKSLKNMVGTE